MKIALVGYGRMGHAVEEVALARGHEVWARVGRSGNVPRSGVDAESMEGVEVAIDFSAPDAVVANIEKLAALGIDTVVGTTGWDASLPRVRGVVEESGIGLIHSANFSVGVHLFLRLVRLAGKLADRVEAYDPHIAETHHRHKLDHPSGTALRAAGILLDEIERKERWVETAGESGSPDPRALHVSVARAGENPGVHVVGLEGADDRIEIRHEARTRAGFARGAVAAAEWVHGRKGIFTMEDWLGGRSATNGGSGGGEGRDA